MYLDDIATVIRSHIPADRLPHEDTAGLLLIYAALARAKGEKVTASDIHDAWAAWKASHTPNHLSLVEYENLSRDVQQEDDVFVAAVRQAAAQLNLRPTDTSQFSEVLFPMGPPSDADDRTQTLDLYKIMVQSSESLVTRRQGVNTFFLTMNGALLTGVGLVIQNSGDNIVGALGVAVLGLAGVILCAAWRSLIISFGQLNRGKFQVINTLEKHMKAAIYAAEWEALGRGEDPKIYRSFTSREIWVPNALLVLNLVSLATSILVYLGWFHIR